MAAKPEEPEITGKTEKPFQIWCDGSHGLEYQIGGWGAVIVHPEGSTKQHSGAISKCTTSIESELWSILKSLKKIPDQASVQVMCDCRSAIDVVHNFLNFFHGKKPVSPLPDYLKGNWNIVLGMIAESRRLGIIQLKWVKGHADDKRNRNAHKLALAAMRETWQRRQKKELLRRKHWKTYIVPIAVILDQSGYVRQKGEVRRITERLCADGLLDATNPYDQDNLPTMPTAAQIVQIAQKLHLELRGGLVAA